MEDDHGLIHGAMREIIFYRTSDGDAKVEVLLYDENLWLTQKKMAELFETERSVVTKHLSNIYQEEELNKEATCAKIAQVQVEGERQVSRKIEYYNLDAIIAVGYRVNSKKATHFRIWANSILKEYIIKGFAMDDERLKDPRYTFGKDYFEEQLERIRDIRSSERRFYQKITDIYAQCSADYDVNSETTKNFFATIQNKLHYAIANETAAEIIYHRADSSKEHMGLKTWKNAPEGRIRKSDVSIAKNYLSGKELDLLNRIVTMYLDYAEMQAREQNVMYMEDWVERLNAFLKFNRRDILTDNGKITAELAKTFAESEYEKYRIKQDLAYKSDFDRLIESVAGKKLGDESE